MSKYKNKRTNLMYCQDILNLAVQNAIGDNFDTIYVNLPLTDNSNRDIANLTKIASNKYCSCPISDRVNCEGNIIYAHSIAKSDALKKIAQDGHVYTLLQKDAINFSKNNGEFTIKKIGINNASTFSGFCSKHDREIFSPIENHPLQINTQHAFLLAYRALALGLYSKQHQQKAMESLSVLSLNKDIIHKTHIENILMSYTPGIELGMKDLQYWKKKFDQVLISRDYTNIKYYAIEFDSIPEVMTCLFLSLENDFAGLPCQSSSWKDPNSILKNISFSLLHFNGHGVAYFSWYDDNSSIAGNFIQSLNSLPDDQLPHAIIRFTFEYSENTYISPVWWNSLSPKSTAALISRMESGVRRNRNQASLLDDNIRVVNWNIIKRHTNM